MKRIAIIPPLLVLGIAVWIVPAARAIEFRELATSPIADGAPGFSPDGLQVSFSSNRSGDWEIYTVPAAGGEPLNITENPNIDIYANWAPSGDEIIFSSTRDNGAGSGDYDLWVVNLNSGELECLTEFTGYDNFAAYNPAGTHIAFTSDRGPEGRKSIWLLELARHTFTQLSFGLDTCFHSNWSPDGKWIAFDGRDPDTPSQWSLYRISVNGGAAEEIPQGMQSAVDPGWSPDGRYLAFGGGDHLTDWDLWLWDFDTASLVQLTSTREAEQSPYWNAAGTEIVYARVANENKDVWVAYDLGLDTPVRRGSWSDLKRAFER